MVANNMGGDVELPVTRRRESQTSAPFGDDIDGRTQFTSTRHRYEDDDEIEVGCNGAQRPGDNKARRKLILIFVLVAGAMILGLAGLGVSGQGGRLNAALSLWLDASSSDKRPSAGGGDRNSSGGLQES